MLDFHSLYSMKGRTALITGASGNLGFQIAETLADLGAHIILTDVEKKALLSCEEKLNIKHGPNFTAILSDLEDEKSRDDLIRDVLQKNKSLDVLVNCAAFVGTSSLPGWLGSLENQSLATWRRALEVNLTAPFHLAKGLASSLKASGKGTIINIVSIYGELGPDWSLYEGTELGNPAAYSASKGGLIQITRWLATTLAPHIRVNAISPGGIFRNQPEVFVGKYSSRTPLMRMATEKDLSGVIGFLASDASSYVTGQIFRVDGGWSIW